MVEIPHYHLNEDGTIVWKTGPEGSYSVKLDYSIRETSSYSNLALIDRDGVINQKAKKHTYILRPDDVHVLDGVGIAIGYLNKGNIPVVVITNQPCIDKGLITTDELYDIDIEMAKQIDSQTEGSPRIDAVVYCPHAAPTEGDPEEKGCTCRKPEPGMLELAIRLFPTERGKTFMFGDFAADIKAAKNAGVNPVYVATRHDEYEEMMRRIERDYPDVYNNRRYDNLFAAVSDIFD